MWRSSILGLSLVLAGANSPAVSSHASPASTGAHTRRSFAECAALATATLAKLGVTPTTLAVVGTDDNAVSAIVGVARLYCETHAGELATVASEQARLARLIQALEDVVRSGAATADQRAQLEQARDDAADIIAGEQSHFDTIQGVIASSLSAEQRDQLAVIMESAHSDAPVVLRVIPRSDEDLVALRSETERADAIQNDPDVMVADFLYHARIVEVAAAWQTAMGE